MARFRQSIENQFLTQGTQQTLAVQRNLRGSLRPPQRSPWLKADA